MHGSSRRAFGGGSDWVEAEVQRLKAVIAPLKDTDTEIDIMLQLCAARGCAHYTTLLVNAPTRTYAYVQVDGAPRRVGREGKQVDEEWSMDPTGIVTPQHAQLGSVAGGEPARGLLKGLLAPAGAKVGPHKADRWGDGPVEAAFTPVIPIDPHSCDAQATGVPTDRMAAQHRASRAGRQHTALVPRATRSPSGCAPHPIGAHSCPWSRARMWRHSGGPGDDVNGRTKQ